MAEIDFLIATSNELPDEEALRTMRTEMQEVAAKYLGSAAVVHELARVPNGEHLGDATQRLLDGELISSLVGSAELEDQPIATRAMWTRAANATRKHGVLTVRDALLRGSVGLHALKNTGDAMTRLLLDSLTQRFPQLPLYDEPTPAQVATFCPDLTCITTRNVPGLDRQFALVGRERLPDTVEGFKRRYLVPEAEPCPNPGVQAYVRHFVQGFESAQQRMARRKV